MGMLESCFMTLQIKMFGGNVFTHYLKNRVTSGTEELHSHSYNDFYRSGHMCGPFHHTNCTKKFQVQKKNLCVIVKIYLLTNNKHDNKNCQQKKENHD